MAFNPLFESANILYNEEGNYGAEIKKIMTVLEDVNSPVTRKYQETLFKSVIDKGHVDFGDIPNSSGNIKNYKGYQPMVETLDVIEKLAAEQNVKDVQGYVKIVKTAIANIESLSATFQKGFAMKSDYVMAEYNTFVFTCIEATTTLCNSFVEYVKRPDQLTLKMVVKNTKYRADLYYFEQLTKFNNVNAKMGMDYRKMLEAIANKGKNNFFGVDEIVGVAAISLAAMAIVPITRELIYQVYKMRGNLSNMLDCQVNFLEMNKTCIEANQAMTTEEKSRILSRQNALKNKLSRLADTVRVKSNRAVIDARKDLHNANSMLSIDGLRNEISNSPLEII